MFDQSICMKLLYSESEEEVSAIIKSCDVMSNMDNWHYLDDRETNFNVVTNQASSGSKALAELCTNMVDAVLMRYAYEAGLDPKSDQAPKTVYDGVKELVTKLSGVRNGRLADADSQEELRIFANEHLQIGITGGRNRRSPLCFTFIDAGEGQEPDNFPTTFLSLRSLNKADIPFVQGKFNMGSSGVLSFCGQHGYKLIVSRRWNTADSGDWGWTLLRRDPRHDQFVVHYIAPNGVIPRFSSNYIDACRCRTIDGNSWEPDQVVRREFGTIVKLYNYNLGPGHSAEFNKLRADMNLHLISTILPFRILDYRQTPDPERSERRKRGIDERQFCGLETFLKYSDRGDSSAVDDDNVALHQDDSIAEIPKMFRQRFDVGSGGTPKLGKFHIYAFPLKRKLPDWLRPRVNNSRVFHAVNGQVHMAKNRGFLTYCNFSAIQDRVLIVVDATCLTPRAHNDIWKGDRETVRQTPTGQEYLTLVREEIESSKALKEYSAHVRRQESEVVVSKSRVEVLERLMKKDSSVARLLTGGEDLQLPRRHRPAPYPSGEEFIGLSSPTYLKHAKPHLESENLVLPAGSQRSVVFETDACNGYLDRAENTGELNFEHLPSDFSIPGRDLINGVLTTKWRCPKERAIIGKVFAVNVTFGDDGMPQPLSQVVNVEIGPPVPSSPRPGPPNPNPTPPKPRSDNLPTKGMPAIFWLVNPKAGPPIELEKDHYATRLWSDPPTCDRYPNFDEHDGGFTDDLGDDEFVYYINYHNVHLQNVLRKVKDESERVLIVNQYEIAMFLQLLGLESALGRRSQEVNAPDGGILESKDLVRRLVAASAANVILTIVRELPSLHKDTQTTSDD